MSRALVTISGALLVWSCALDEGGKQGSKPTGGGGGSSIEAGTAAESGAGAVEDGSSGDRFVAPVDGESADVSGSDATTLSGCNAATAHARADASLERMITGFWNETSQYFDATEPANGRLTGYWTFAQAFDAVLDGVERTTGRKYFTYIETLYAAQNARGWSSPYYDDESSPSTKTLPPPGTPRASHQAAYGGIARTRRRQPPRTPGPSSRARGSRRGPATRRTSRSPARSTIFGSRRWWIR